MNSTVVFDSGDENAAFWLILGVDCQVPVWIDTTSDPHAETFVWISSHDQFGQSRRWRIVTHSQNQL